MKANRLIISVLAFTVISFGAMIGTISAGLAPKLGLDLAGGISVVLRPAHKVSPTVLTEAINIIRNRVDALGVTQPNIGSQGGDVLVELPGIKNRARVIHIIGETAQLYFRPVLCAAPAYSPPASKPGQKAPASPGPLPSSCPAADQYSAANLKVNTSSGLPTASPLPDAALAAYPTTSSSQDVPGKPALLYDAQAHQRFLVGPAGLTGHALSSATAQLSSTGSWQVAFTLTSSGSPKWDALAKANFHQMVAVDLDAKIESAPLIQPTQAAFTSFNGSGVISGSNFTQSSAKSLALVLQYGALPVRLVRQTVQSVSPTLGKSSLIAGLAAGLVGLLLVMLYMIFYYRGLGIVVVLGLATTAALLWAIVSLLGMSGLTLDLSGVVGMIVSVGITVDSYVVYFERLKDEVRAGRSVRSSVDRGFSRAYRTVLAADLVSLIGAVLLYELSIGPVKGFAFFLGLSTVLDLASAYLFTRPFVILLGRNRTFTEARTLGVASGLAAAPGGTP